MIANYEMPLRRFVHTLEDLDKYFSDKC